MYADYSSNKVPTSTPRPRCVYDVENICLHQYIHNGMKSNEVCNVFVLECTQNMIC